MKTTLIIAAMLALSAGTAAQDPGYKDDRARQTKQIKTDGYDEIAVSGSYTVELVPGTEGNITVSGDADDLKKLVVESDGSTLSIHHNKEFGWKGSKRTVRITVPFESIDGVTLAGSGSITAKDAIKADSFEAALSGSGKLSLNVDAKDMEVSMSGSGRIELKGHANKLESSLSGSGELEAYGLTASTAEATVSGSGNCQVNCTEAITARVSGSGRINYKGNPAKEDTKVSGSGRVSKS